ncbi:MAG TPA: hypothetical protein PKE04_19860 [Clostridia bacterium]|nr:hypothetical protein [Clostridia bacterium]
MARRTMKRAAALTAALALTVALAFAPARVLAAWAEPAPDFAWFSESYQAAASACFLDDGRILFLTQKTENNAAVLAQIQCVDAAGTLLWARDAPAGVGVRFARMRPIADGRYALIGKMGDGLWRMQVFDGQGTLFLDETLPPGARSPSLASDGVLYATQPSDSDIPALWKRDWPGETRQIPIEPMRSLVLWDRALGPDDALVPILYRNLDGERAMALLCLDGEGGVRWQFSPGPFAEWTLLAWTQNQSGGAAVFAQRRAEGKTQGYVFRLDDCGRVLWRDELFFQGNFEGQLPTAQILSQAENGDYRIWGNASAPGAPGGHAIFKLILDADGGYVSSELKSARADCRRYLGEIYAVADSDGKPRLFRFDDLPSIEGTVAIDRQ